MHLTLTLLPVAIGLTVAYLVYVQVDLYRRRRRNDCQPAPHASPWDPILGIKHASGLHRAMRNHRNLEYFDNMFKSFGNTFEVGLLGNLMHVTCDPENIKAILATNFHDWCVSRLSSPVMISRASLTVRLCVLQGHGPPASLGDL
jgi:hypothetical protein